MKIVLVPELHVNPIDEANSENLQESKDDNSQDNVINFKDSIKSTDHSIVMKKSVSKVTYLNLLVVLLAILDS